MYERWSEYKKEKLKKRSIFYISFLFIYELWIEVHFFLIYDVHIVDSWITKKEEDRELKSAFLIQTFLLLFKVPETYCLYTSYIFRLFNCLIQ